MTKYVFGLDGGGTSARLRVESLGGELLFYGEGGSTNPNSNPPEAVLAVLSGLFQQAWDKGLRPGDCVAGFAGSAGVDRPGDRGTFTELLRKASGLSCPLGAGNDAEPALAGAIGDVEGFLLIAGTGSIAYGRTRSGESARAGGWGHFLGDEGSAFQIAFDGLKRGLRSLERRDLPSGLLDAGLEFFKLEDPGALIPLVYSRFDKAAIARFARVVGAHRDAGDALAVDIFRLAALDLAGMVASVYGALGARIARKRLAFRGGLIEADEKYRESVAAAVRARLPDLEIVQAKADAATGACILARSLL